MPALSLRRRSPLLGGLAALLAVAQGITIAAPTGEMGRPLLQAFTPRDYRAHQQIWMGAQAPDGVMWFGNSHSVLSYDGTQWRRIEVPTSFVRTLAIGPDGRLFVGGTDQMGTITAGPDGAPIFASLIEKIPADRRPLGVIWSMIATRDALWFATESLVLRWREGKFDTWAINGKPRQLLLTVGDDLYLHRQGFGLFRFDGRDFTEVSSAPELIAAPFCAIERGPDGNLILNLGGNGFFRLRGAALEHFPTPLDPMLARTRLRHMERIPDGTRVIATQSLGVIVADAEFRFLTRVSSANGLESESILSLTRDREGGVWIGTGNGVVRLDPSPRFSFFDGTNGLPRGLVRDVCRHDGTLFAATPEGVVRLEPAQPDSGTAARFTPLAGGPGVCWSLASHTSGLLMATDKGVLQLVAGSATPQPVFSASEGVSKLAILPGQPDRVFVGRFGGLSVLRFENGRWRDEGGVAGLTTEVRTVAAGTDSALWLGTPTRGFIKVTRPAGTADDDWSRTTFTAYREDHGLPGGQGWSHVYNVGTEVVFVTDVGTYRYDAAADRFVIAERLQIPERHARTQLWPLTPTDRADRIWAQADTEETELPRLLGALTLQPAGPARFEPLPRKILERIAFGGARFAGWERDVRGESLWVSGPDALARIDLGATATPPAPWGVLLTDCTLPDGSHLVPTPNAAPARLAYGRGPLTFAFSAGRFGAGPGLKFQTRLHGYHESWSPWSARTEATFTGLWGGPFTLDVRAQDPDGIVSAVASFTFSITPPWHLRPIAFVLYALAALAVIFEFVRWRLDRAERERLRLEGIVAERTHQLATARDQAEAASRAKSAFLASMSHELRTPLNGVIGYAQILQADTRLATDQRERVRIVHQSGEHLLRMINDVLDLAKIEAGKIELRPAPFALGEMIADVCAAHLNTAAGKRLAFHRELAADLPVWVEGDAQKLRQILDNLIGNAVKFTASGSVTLRVARRVPAPAFERGAPEECGHGDVPAHLEFAITDTGPGIAAADQVRLFQPFEQARAVRPNSPGTGLGLAISRALVERMGGTLTLASEVGRGSTFSFSVALPAHDAAALKPAAPAVTGYEGPRHRVLIVDDHAVNRSLLADLLAPLGFACHEEISGEAALARLTAGHEPWPDLAIVDLRMDGMDGLELTRRLRALPRGAALRVLLTSASVISFDSAEARTAGCDDFLPKPFRTEDLIEKLGVLLALRWQAARPASRHPFGAPPPDATPIPEAARTTLRDVLAQGDLQAFRAALARVRAEHPGADARWDELDEAAAGFQLSRLRSLLESP